MNLKRKAPFIKLNCEKILESLTSIESSKNENGIQTLSRQNSETRKVNQSQEIKLRHLIQIKTYPFCNNRTSKKYQ